ncbi:hypothetical protein JCM21142_41602 [Saccharicrinis fermentans DSM 9555 = JCM 21142]|uniref:Uncharacterized protein n=1 Tax=Saccharicrinis fermentans DSM 9555 = JCM 21142 TaxID=869213 RepID=W7YES7_9BACT|nr:hypothetical protein JCM21142_41602 [Saccharicrinis fermentans DSM 9555 = JCM 21142]
MSDVLNIIKINTNPANISKIIVCFSLSEPLFVRSMNKIGTTNQKVSPTSTLATDGNWKFIYFLLYKSSTFCKSVELLIT